MNLTLLEVDLSRNVIGSLFCEALPSAFAATPLLETLNLERNVLGVKGGVELARVLGFALSLRTLNIAGNQLCGPDPCAWTSDAITALASAVRDGGSLSLTEIDLSSNELAGLWPDFIGSERVTRGAYTSAGLEALLAAFGGETRLPLTQLRCDPTRQVCACLHKADQS
eukprot:3334355-Prymnesium_polylepis.2